MTNETYKGFYIEVNAWYYLATCYAPWHIIRDKDLDELKKKIDYFLKQS